jgi:hypothetical protein
VNSLLQNPAEITGEYDALPSSQKINKHSRFRMARLHPQIPKQTRNGRFHSFILCGSGLSAVNIFVDPRSCSQGTKRLIQPAERPGRPNHNNLEAADYSYSMYRFDHSHYQELPPSDKPVSVSVKAISRFFTL